MSNAGQFTVERRPGPLPADEVTAVVELAAAAGEVDGTHPLSEPVVLRLRQAGDPAATHLLAREGQGQLVGYAHLDPTDPAGGLTAELVVHPGARQRGLGRQLAAEALAVAGPAGELRVWAHGDLPTAAALAGRLGFARSRVLLQLRRSLRDDLAPPQLPAGVTIRSFHPGEDDAAWLALNARAFADHPEQGRWTEHDLRLRQAEPWFDPAGFLLAVREADAALLGFHWTKVHLDQPVPIGEVYVLGVDPAAHGLGLGTALTLAGLHHLRQRGLDQVMLYVDESNQAAVKLYTKLGFAPWSVDVTYARTVGESAQVVSG